MKYYSVLFCALIILFSIDLFAQCTDPYADHPDYEVMEAIFMNTGNEDLFDSFEWVLEFSDICNPCHWYGVNCNGNGRVSQLTLRDVFKNIPPEIGDLPYLEKLYLSSMEYEGELPEEIFSSPFMTDVGISDIPGLRGGIPATIGNLVNLEELNITDVGLDGTIPSEIGMCQQIEALRIFNTNLTGELPPEICTLNNAWVIMLRNNNFNGELPADIGQLSTAVLLILTHNNFTGGFPESFSQLSSTYVDLRHNNLSGCFDSSILNHCGSLHLSGNKLLPWEGEMGFYCHSSLGYLSQLGSFCDDGNPQTEYSAIDVNCNCTGVNEDPMPFCENVSSELPALLEIFKSGSGSSWNQGAQWVEGFLSGNCDPCNWANLNCNSDGRVISISIDDDEFDGWIVNEYCDLEYLETIDIDEEATIMGIETGIGDCANLKNLILTEGYKHGPFRLPAEIGNLNNLEVIRIEGQHAYGEIPEEIYNLSNLKTLSLRYNYFCGEVSESIAGLESLETLNLSGNKFDGEIPQALGALPELEEVYLGSNKFSGAIPSELSNMQVGSNLYLNNNLLDGCIPPEFYSWCDGSREINLSNNRRLSWKGNMDSFCLSDGTLSAQIGAVCNSINYTNGIYSTLKSYVTALDGVILSDNCTCSSPEYEIVKRPDLYKFCSDDDGIALGITTEDEISELKLYPNPASNMFSMDLSSLGSSEVDILITNATGKILYSKRVNAIQNYSVETTDFMSGVYLVLVRTKEKKYSEKLIKL